MSKTYSVAFLGKLGHWITNWGEYFSLDDIKWEDVREAAQQGKYIAYGYYYGEHSKNLTSDRCRTVIESFQLPEYNFDSAMKILHSGGRIFYTGLDGDIKWFRYKVEDVGYTFQFGKNFDDKIIQKRWYTNGESDLINFVTSNLGITNEE